jgi:hypothetical protein
MSRLDPQFGQDFRPGYRPSTNPDYSLFAVLDQDPHPDDYRSDFDGVEEGRKAARGILNCVGVAAVFWSFVAAIVLLVGGI